MTYTSPRVHSGEIYHHTQMQVVELFKRANYHLAKTRVHVSKEDLITIEMAAFAPGEFGGTPSDSYEDIIDRIYTCVEKASTDVVIVPHVIPHVKGKTIALAFKTHYRDRVAEEKVVNKRFFNHPDSVTTRATIAAREALGITYNRWITVGDYAQHHQTIKDYGLVVQLMDITGRYVVGLIDTDEIERPVKRLILSYDGTIPAFDASRGNQIATLDVNVYDRLYVVDPLTLPTYQYPFIITHKFYHNNEFNIELMHNVSSSKWSSSWDTVSVSAKLDLTRHYVVYTSWYSNHVASVDALARAVNVMQFALEIAEDLRQRVDGKVITNEPS